jgi:ABC-type uncharacterized transport system auxiliary subunit
LTTNEKQIVAMKKYFPQSHAIWLTVIATCTIRLLTSSPAAKAPIFLVATPSDRTVAIPEGGSIWHIRMRSWGDQIDELVQRCLYSDALSLLDT